MNPQKNVRVYIRSAKVCETHLLFAATETYVARAVEMEDTAEEYEFGKGGLASKPV